LKSTFATVFNNTIITNILIIPIIENQKGFESCVVLYYADIKLIFYLQMKIAKTSNTSRLKAVANTIYQTIKNHIEDMIENKNADQIVDINFENINIAYYDWSDDENINIMQEEIITEIKKILLKKT
jgi:hypothetical protein